MKLFLKGEKCYNDDKCGVKKRPYPPGPNGKFSRRERNMSEYGLQLREKQRARKAFGVGERQFRKYFEEVSKKEGVTGEMFFSLLERRLDNVVYRMGFGSSRAFARQIVRHRHITVNGRIVDIPSYIVSVNDVIEVKQKSKENKPMREAANNASASKRIPAWIEVNPIELKGTVLDLPTGEKLTIPVQDHLIVEFYSR